MAVKIKNLILGEGRPKVCVPVTAKGEAGLKEQLEKISCADMLEWRIDFFSEIESSEIRKRAAGKIRERFPQMPLLCTFRSKREGGEGEMSPEEYAKLCESILEEELADILDVELSAGDKVIERILKKAREHGVPVLLSSHDFEKTPSKEEMKERLLEMDRLGADILKLAVMPKSSEDVLKLLEVTNEMKELTKKPIITMSMGKLGLVSRLSGSTFGSAVTFGRAGEGSAPGQIEAGMLMEILELF